MKTPHRINKKIALAYVGMLLAVILTGIVTAGEAAYDAVISWRHEKWNENLSQRPQPDSTVAIPAYLYFWNDAFVGAGNNGLAEIYDRLKAFKGKSVLFKHRPREWGNSLNDPLDSDILRHFSNLMRKKTLTFTIEYSDDKRDIVGVPRENPFRPKSSERK